MTRLSEQAARQRLLWLDHQDYSARLLAGGRYPWLETAECVALLRQAHSLLRPGVLALPVADMAAAWLARDAHLREAMAGKARRAHGPLKELLASPGLRSQAAALATALRAAAADAVLALVMPSPRDWVAQALADVGDHAGIAVDEDAVDAGAACIADFLRGFASVGVDAVLMREAAAWAPGEAALWLELAQPVANVAHHYGWAWGLQWPDLSEALPAGPPERFAIVPAHAADNGGDGLRGIAVPAGFWQTGVAPAAPAGTFDFAQVPADATPETVLARLAPWREK